jgi:hypothetical protein
MKSQEEMISFDLRLFRHGSEILVVRSDQSRAEQID